MTHPIGDAIIPSVKHATHNKGHNAMTATKTPRIVDASNIARIADSYRARMGETDIDADFVAACDDAFETATMQRFDADMAGRKIKTQPGRQYRTELEGIFALMADSQSTVGAYAAKFAIIGDDAEVAEVAVSAATHAAIAAYDLADTDTDTETPDCSACDRVASYGTKCRTHARG